MPPAIKIVGGWVTLITGLPVPYDHHDIMSYGHEWEISREMVQRMNNRQLQRTFFFARLPQLAFPLLTCVLLWWWGRQLFSPWAGIAVAAAFSLEPLVVGHGALFKNDLAASFAYLHLFYRCWKYWIVPSMPAAAWLGAAALLAVLSKLSLLVFLPVPLLVIWFRKHAKSGLAAGIVCLVVYAGIVAAWQFRVSRVSNEAIREWRSDPLIPAVLPPAAQLFRLIPTPHRLREGVISLVRSNAENHSVYYRGRIYDSGIPHYFLTAMLVKTPEPQLVLMAGGMILALWMAFRKRLSAPDMFWLLPGPLYFVLASMSTLQLGLRLVLPAITFLILISGLFLHWLIARGKPQVAAALLAGVAFCTAMAYPHYVSSFNYISGGPDRGIEWFTDSNLDWGQNFPDLRELMDANGWQGVRLIFFSNDNPYGRLGEDRIDPVPWPAENGPKRFEPAPGLYAVSATMLTGQFFEPALRDYYAAFRNLKPIAKAGYSIFVYRVP